MALQTDDCYVEIIDDDAEKIFDRMHMELQAALLLLADTGMHGFTEWPCTNMCNRTNKLVTDIFVADLKYQLLMWWNMGQSILKALLPPSLNQGMDFHQL